MGPPAYGAGMPPMGAPACAAGVGPMGAPAYGAGMPPMGYGAPMPPGGYAAGGYMGAGMGMGVAPPGYHYSKHGKLKKNKPMSAKKMVKNMLF